MDNLCLFDFVTSSLVIFAFVRVSVNEILRFYLLQLTLDLDGEVVVAQLVERLLSIPEVRGSTPVIGKILLNICLLSTVLKRRK